MGKMKMQKWNNFNVSEPTSTRQVVHKSGTLKYKYYTNTNKLTTILMDLDLEQNPIKYHMSLFDTDD